MPFPLAIDDDDDDGNGPEDCCCFRSAADNVLITVAGADAKGEEAK